MYEKIEQDLKHHQLLIFDAVLNFDLYLSFILYALLNLLLRLINEPVRDCIYINFFQNFGRLKREDKKFCQLA